MYKDLTTQWYKLEYSKYSSSVRLYHGSLEYRTYKGDIVNHILSNVATMTIIKICIYAIATAVLHRLKAKVVYRTIGASMNFKG